MTLPELPTNIKLISKYENITPALEADLETLARNHLIKFSGSYLKSFLQKADAIVLANITFVKNKQEKYEAKCDFVLDGDKFHRENDVPFKEPLDVINHAFKHLKEYLANK